MKLNFFTFVYFFYILVLLIGFPVVCYLIIVGIPNLQKYFPVLNWILTVSNSYSTIYGFISLLVCVFKYFGRKKYYFWDTTRGKYICLLDNDVKSRGSQIIINESKLIPIDGRIVETKGNGQSLPSITIIVPISSIMVSDQDKAPDVCCTSNFIYYSPDHVESTLREIGNLAYDPESTVNVIVVHNNDIKFPHYNKDLRQMLKPLQDEYFQKYFKKLYFYSPEQKLGIIDSLNSTLGKIQDGVFAKTTYLTVIAPEEHPEHSSLVRATSLFERTENVGIQYRNVLLNNCTLCGAVVGTEMELSYVLRNSHHVFLQEMGFFVGGVGFWKTDVLTELRFDPTALFQGIDLSIRAISEGYKVMYSSDIIVYREMTLGMTNVIGKKVYWCRGWIRNSYNNLKSFVASKHVSCWDKMVQIFFFIFSELIYYVSIQSIPVFICYLIVGTYVVNTTFVATTIIWVLIVPLNVIVMGINNRLTSDHLAPESYKPLSWLQYFVYVVMYPIYDYIGFFVSIGAHLVELGQMEK